MIARTLKPVVGLVTLCAWFAVGCTSFRYGPAPIPPASTASRVQRCAFEGRMIVSKGSGRQQLLNETSYRYPYIYARGRTASQSGLTFYRGATRLTPSEGLSALDDDGLLLGYEQDLDRYAGASAWNTTSRILWITLFGGGLAATLAGIPQIRTDSEGNLETTGVAITGAGLGGMLLGALFLYFDYASGSKAATYDLRRKLYVPQDPQRLADALDRHNTTALRRCQQRSR